MECGAQRSGDPLWLLPPTSSRIHQMMGCSQDWIRFSLSLGERASLYFRLNRPRLAGTIETIAQIELPRKRPKRSRKSGNQRRTWFSLVQRRSAVHAPVRPAPKMKLKHLAALLLAVLPFSALAQAERSQDAAPNTVLWSIFLSLVPIFVVIVLLILIYRKFQKPLIKRSQDHLARQTQHMERVEQLLERVANAVEKKN